MGLNLIVVFPKGNQTWEGIYSTVSKYFNREIEFFPIPENIYLEGLYIGIVIGEKADKGVIGKLISKLKINKANITELYNGENVTVENLDTLLAE